MSLFLKFGEITSFFILVLVNEVISLYHSTNQSKKVRNEYTMDHLIPQTK